MPRAVVRTVPPIRVQAASTCRFDSHPGLLGAPSHLVDRVYVPVSILLAIALLVPVDTRAQTVPVSLDFTSLPSAQGWEFRTSGKYAETALFSVDGTTLHQKTMGTGITSEGGGAF